MQTHFSGEKEKNGSANGCEAIGHSAAKESAKIVSMNTNIETLENGTRKAVINSFINKVGQPRWMVTEWESADRRGRPTFPSLEKAQAEAKIWVGNAERENTWDDLTAEQQIKLMRAWNDASRYGVDVLSCVHASHQTVLEAKQAKVGHSLQSVYDLLIAEVQVGNARPKYVQSLESIVGRFIDGRSEQAVESVTTEQVQQWIDGTFQLKSKVTARKRLSAFFAVAVRKGYLEFNPCCNLARVKVDAEPVVWLSSEQVRQCLDFLAAPAHKADNNQTYCWQDCLPWFVMTVACGLRPEEASNIPPTQVNGKCLRVYAANTKTRKPRVVYPTAEAMRLLALIKPYHTATLTENRRKACLRQLRELLGLSVWPKDSTRHTALSCWLARTNDAALVSRMAGNSVAVLLKHYDAAVEVEQAEAFWALCNSWQLPADAQPVATAAPAVPVQADIHPEELLPVAPVTEPAAVEIAA